MTIKAICDRCDKEVTLKYSEPMGVESPPGWKLVSQFNPLTWNYDYRTFCPECKSKVVRIRKDERKTVDIEEAKENGGETTRRLLPRLSKRLIA